MMSEDIELDSDEFKLARRARTKRRVQEVLRGPSLTIATTCSLIGLPLLYFQGRNDLLATGVIVYVTGLYGLFVNQIAMAEHDSHLNSIGRVKLGFKHKANRDYFWHFRLPWLLPALLGALFGITLYFR